MISVTSLWLPIVLSAVAVFIISSIIHMVLPYHRKDYGKLPNETAILESLRAQSVTPGAYFFPHAESLKEAGTDEMKAKFAEGPVGMMTVIPNGPPMMPKHLVQWFVFSLVVGVFAAYIAGRTLAAGTDYLMVFRIVASAAFLAYGIGQISDSIWKGQSWTTTAKGVFDGLIYGLFTGGVFGWLWP